VVLAKPRGQEVSRAADDEVPAPVSRSDVLATISSPARKAA